MEFCKNCGFAVKEDAAFCVNCGERIYTNSEANKQSNTSSESNVVLAVVLPILFFLPLLTEPKTEFGTFWANQSLLLLLSFLLSSFLSSIFIGYLMGLVALVFWVLAIVSVAKEEMKPIPLIGAIQIIK